MRQYNSDNFWIWFHSLSKSDMCMIGTQHAACGSTVYYTIFVVFRVSNTSASLSVAPPWVRAAPRAESIANIGLIFIQLLPVIILLLYNSHQIIKSLFSKYIMRRDLSPLANNIAAVSFTKYLSKTNNFIANSCRRGRYTCAQCSLAATDHCCILLDPMESWWHRRDRYSVGKLDHCDGIVSRFRVHSEGDTQASFITTHWDRTHIMWPDRLKAQA